MYFPAAFAFATVLALLPFTAAWSLTVNTADNWCGSRRTYFSRSSQNDCYTFSDDVAAKVHSLAWCTSRTLERCVVTFHSDRECMGSLLKTKEPGSVFSGSDQSLWETSHVTNEVAAKSFRVQGCFNVKLPLGSDKCYKKGEAPWEKARFCTPAKRAYPVAALPAEVEEVEEIEEVE
jgi:hypothetical protein